MKLLIVLAIILSACAVKEPSPVQNPDTLISCPMPTATPGTEESPLPQVEDDPETDVA